MPLHASPHLLDRVIAELPHTLKNPDCIPFLLWLGASINITTPKLIDDRLPPRLAFKERRLPCTHSSKTRPFFPQQFKQHPIPCPRNQIMRHGISRQFDPHIAQISSSYGPIGSATTIGLVIGPQSILSN
jgi:hypothetical protein